MRTVRVTDPAGLEWAVRVEWAPRYHALFRRFRARRRSRRKDDRGWDIADLAAGADDPISAIITVVFVLTVAALAWFLVIPLLFLLIDAVIVVLLLLIGLAVRVVLRRPWTVQARAGEHTRELEVTGWRRALRARDGVAAGLRAGGAAAWPSLALGRWDS